MALSLEGKVMRFALTSRLLVIALQVISNLLIPDLEPDVFNPPRKQNGVSYLGNSIASVLFGGLKRWDGIYFLHVAEFGYTYQNCLAFFPLFPFVVRFLSNTVSWPLQFVMSYDYVLLLTAVMVNVYCFTMAALMLYRLGVAILKNRTLAYRAALLFCINPASIFMTAPYSEAMFSYITFRGLLNFQQNKLFRCSLQFGISSMIRSNGLVNFCYIYYTKVKQLLMQFQTIKETRYVDWSSIRDITLGTAFITLFPTFLYSLLMFLPFIVWQYYVYNLYCKPPASDTVNTPAFISDYGKSQGYHMPGDSNPNWCSYYLPLSYSFVQTTHWGNGFLKYYEWKQIPNFLLATPIVVVSFVTAWNYIKRNLKYCICIGLMNENTVSKKTDEPVRVFGLFGTDMFVYVVHMLFLTLFGTFFMHVQVLTRFLCSSTPVIYWFLSWVSSDVNETAVDVDNVYNVMKKTCTDLRTESVKNQNSSFTNSLTDQFFNWHSEQLYAKLTLVFFGSYFVIGTILFSNFYPWT